MHIEDDIAREGETIAAHRYYRDYERGERRFNVICAIIAITIITALSVAIYFAEV